jgi:hypothetical protein
MCVATVVTTVVTAVNTVTTDKEEQVARSSPRHNFVKAPYFMLLALFFPFDYVTFILVLFSFWVGIRREIRRSYNGFNCP